MSSSGKWAATWLHSVAQVPESTDLEDRNSSTVNSSPFCITVQRTFCLALLLSAVSVVTACARASAHHSRRAVRALQSPPTCTTHPLASHRIPPANSARTMYGSPAVAESGPWRRWACVYIRTPAER